MSLSSSSGGGGSGTGVSAASLGWLIDWEHRYGVTTDSSPISLLPVPYAVPQPPSPPVSPPIEVGVAAGILGLTWVLMDGIEWIGVDPRSACFDSIRVH